MLDIHEQESIVGYAEHDQHMVAALPIMFLSLCFLLTACAGQDSLPLTRGCISRRMSACAGCHSVCTDAGGVTQHAPPCLQQPC